MNRIKDNLTDKQFAAVNQAKSGNIIVAGTGVGKTRIGLAWAIKTIDSLGYYDKSIYVITTPKKRDDRDWFVEGALLGISNDPSLSYKQTRIIVDSWNNIKKYIGVKDAIFIFDEQRLVGYGAWVKSFFKISKHNMWLLLTATPGDVWMDYLPVFIANGYFVNKTDFSRKHVIYNPYVTFPQIDRYIGVDRLLKYRDEITVKVDPVRVIPKVMNDVYHDYDKKTYDDTLKLRWDFFKDCPIENASSLCYILRRISIEHDTALHCLLDIYNKHRKLILFYNYNFELDILRNFCKDQSIVFAERNGQYHQSIPEGDSWIYLVNYGSGAEAWNCIVANTIVFYSMNRSYRIMTQAEGRIDRMNTPFDTLYYYRFMTTSPIDRAIKNSIFEKKVFNETLYVKNLDAQKLHGL